MLIEPLVGITPIWMDLLLVLLETFDGFTPPSRPNNVNSLYQVESILYGRTLTTGVSAMGCHSIWAE